MLKCKKLLSIKDTILDFTFMHTLTQNIDYGGCSDVV